jgi:polysaccharide export outer membrane protein
MWALLWVAFASLCLAGCGVFSGSDSQSHGDAVGASTNAPSSNGNPADVYLLRVGDALSVTLSGIENPPAPLTLRVADDGTISLPLIGQVIAVNKSPGQLQTEMRTAYLKYYKDIAVTVLAGDQNYYVGGEVRSPGKYIWVSDMTMLKAIQTAGSFTDFSKKGSVKLLRGDKVIIVNCRRIEKDPRKDLKIYPGDTIIVKRRIF